MFVEFRDTEPGWRYFSIREGHQLSWTLEAPKQDMYGDKRHDRSIPWSRLCESDKEKLKEMKRQVMELAEEIRQRF